ncbi:MAG: PEP/pyruvate-binding domain-containing protein [Acidobacteriota bacterium]
MKLADLRRAFRRRERPPLELPARVSYCREVLQANNAALGYLAQIQETLAGTDPLPAGQVRRLVAGVMTQTFRMIVNLSRITGGRFGEVESRFRQIKASLARSVEVPADAGDVGYTVGLDRLDASFAEVVGQKSAFLGEARRWLPAHVPHGFATSVTAYRAFMDHDGLGARVAEILERGGMGDVASCFELSADIVRLVEGARVPADVAGAIAASLDAIPGGDARRFAVRSSALLEGGAEMSFAGQYRSCLNVPPDGVVDAFKRVIASKYSPEAISYRALRGFDDEDVAMCCCVIEMVDAVAAGVLYSSCQGETEPTTLVQAVRGLGLAAVDGSAEPDSYTAGCQTKRMLGTRLGRQASRIVGAPHEGTVREAIAPGDGSSPVLDESQVLGLAGLAWALQPRLGTPLDMEWAIGRDRRFVILQLRPQPVEMVRGAKPLQRRVVGYRILLEGGSVVSPGVASGPVCHVESDLDMLRCGKGAVLVTTEASPRLAVLLPRVAAVVADLGEVTGHLAAVARELKVPALFATRAASTALAAGAMATVDAEAAVVYEGRVVELVDVPPPPSLVRTIDPNRALLASVADRIVPLTLKDRLASGYTPARCRSLHDIIRFCHQATIEAIFDLGDRALHRNEGLRRLVTDVPIDCRLFDLGGGFSDNLPAGDIRIEDVTCRPMRALWRGMTDPRVVWRASRPVSLTGLASALVNYNLDHDQRMRNLGEPSYAFVTADYLNLNSRVGYHFTTVDARLGEASESNYASLRFVGGSTGVDQRSRRAALIRRLLEAYRFETDCRVDLVNARIRHRPPAEMEEALARVGRLLGYVNHLDMALTSEAAVAEYEAAFLRGDYHFKGSSLHD